MIIDILTKKNRSKEPLREHLKEETFGYKNSKPFILKD